MFFQAAAHACLLSRCVNSVFKSPVMPLSCLQPERRAHGLVLPGAWRVPWPASSARPPDQRESGAIAGLPWAGPRRESETGFRENRSSCGVDWISNVPFSGSPFVVSSYIRLLWPMYISNVKTQDIVVYLDDINLTLDGKSDRTTTETYNKYIINIYQHIKKCTCDLLQENCRQP